MAAKGVSAVVDWSRLEWDSRTGGISSVRDSDSKSGAVGIKSDFTEMLSKGIEEVNGFQKAAEKASMDLASGKNSNIHETMLSVTKAELSFDMMVQMRNKIIESYQEVMRMQV